MSNTKEENEIRKKKIIENLNKHEFFTNQYGETYAKIQHGDHYRIYRVESLIFRQYLSQMIFETNHT